MQSLVATLVAPLILQLSAGDALRLQDREKLADCILMLETQPEEAYEMGLAWQSEGNRPEARHCTALALIELGREEEGAARLENLALASDGGTRAQRAHYFKQAGNAWMLARRPEAAETALAEAIKLAPEDPDVLLTRARALLLQEKWEDAKADLDQVIEWSPADVGALQLRAETRLRLKDADGAYVDVQRAMALEPENIDVLVLRGRVREAQRLASGVIGVD